MVLLVLGTCLGQQVVCLQARVAALCACPPPRDAAMEAVAAIANFSLDLRDPIKTILSWLDILAFDAERLRFSCMVKLGSETQ